MLTMTTNQLKVSYLITKVFYNFTKITAVISIKT